MIDSNGLSVSSVAKIAPSQLYYVRVSLDGATPSTHDRVRGTGMFTKALAGIKVLIGAGHRVRITYTVFGFNAHEVSAILELAEELGIAVVNFHNFSPEGYGAGHRDWALSPGQWADFCQTIVEIRSRFRVGVRYPPTWVRADDLAPYVDQGFRGCIGCSLDRLSIFPDGRCYVCSLLLDTPLNFGLMTDHGLVLNRKPNEYELFTSAAMHASRPELMGCPAEAALKQYPGEGLVSVCRLWRAEA